MQIKPNSFAIVIIGRWNPYILTPQWITENLFENKPPVQIEFSLNLDLPNRYRINNVFITPTTEKIILTSFDNSHESLIAMGNVAVKLCSILLHTPVMSLGINFGYFENENKEELLEMFAFEKNDPFSNDGWNIKSYTVKKFMVKDKFQLNLTTTIDENNDLHFEFNYHYNVPNRDFLETLFNNDNILSFKENSLELLNNVYKLKLPSYE